MTERIQISREAKLEHKRSTLRIWRNLFMQQSAMALGAVALMIFFFSDAGIAVIVILGFILCIMPVRTLIQFVGIKREIEALER